MQVVTSIRNPKDSAVSEFHFLSKVRPGAPVTFADSLEENFFSGKGLLLLCLGNLALIIKQNSLPSDKVSLSRELHASKLVLYLMKIIMSALYVGPYGSWFDHVLGYWGRRHEKNHLVLKYEDMKRVGLQLPQWANHA